MTKPTQRTFLQMMGTGAAAGAVPPSIARALEIPAHNRAGTIDDVKHIVILMQENRSFDHHFGSLQIEFSNLGRAAAVSQVRPGSGDDAPRNYTVEPDKQLSGKWPVVANGKVDYDLDVHGPNGFLRSFKGCVGGHGKAVLDVSTTCDEPGERITIWIANRAERTAIIRLADRYGDRVSMMKLEPKRAGSESWTVRRTFGWYDIVITVEGDSGFEVRLAGHVEAGRPTSAMRRWEDCD